MICLQNRAVGYIYTTLLLSANAAGGELSRQFSVTCAHTHTHRHEVCCCARMCVCAYPNPHRPLHNDTGISIAIHLVRLTYLSFCPRAFSLLSAGLHGGNNWLQLVSNFPRWPFKLCAAGQVINIPSESWTPAGTKVKAALLLIGLCDNYANLAFLRWYYIWLYSWYLFSFRSASLRWLPLRHVKSLWYWNFPPLQ